MRWRVFHASVLSLQEMDELRRRRRQSMFSREFALFSRRLVMTGNTWLRTQLIIMFITSCLCILGLVMIRNPYCILLGLGIGILDALPLFGTGAVLVPWSLILLVQKQWYEGIVLAGLFIVCCLVRGSFDGSDGVMGRTAVGALCPHGTLAAIYVGLKLFGILGVLLGPIGLLIIEDLVEEYAGTEK